MSALDFNILIVEDEFAYADALEELVLEIGCNVLGLAESAEQALLILNQKAPDLILMDYNIKGEMNGIALAQHIKTHIGSIPVIFITSYNDDDLFREAKGLGAYSFLNKPFDNVTLQRNIDLVVSQLIAKENVFTKEDNGVLIKEFLFVKMNGIMKKVKITDIAVVSLEERHAVIFAQNKKFAIRKSLSEIIELLGDSLFIQVHRSHIINTNKIESINLGKLEITVEDYKIPIGRTYKDELINRIQII